MNRGGHHLVAILAPDPVVQFALFQFAGDDPGVAIDTGEGLLPGIEAEFRLLVACVRAVALEAAIREDGPDVTIEVDFPGGR